MTPPVIRAVVIKAALPVCSFFSGYGLRYLMNVGLQLQPHEKENEGEKVSSLLIKYRDELQPEKITTELNQIDGVFCEAAFTALKLDEVFFVLLIHLCGEGLASNISSLLLNMISTAVLLGLTLTSIGSVFVLKKINHLKKDNSQLKEQLKDEQTMLMDMKRKLEDQRNKTKQLLEEVENEKEDNKKHLQALENEIVKREETFDKPEELLRQKENLLREKWKLDQTKKDSERQILNLERLLEPLEMQTAGKH